MQISDFQNWPKNSNDQIPETLDPTPNAYLSDNVRFNKRKHGDAWSNSCPDWTSYGLPTCRQWKEMKMLKSQTGSWISLSWHCPLLWVMQINRDNDTIPCFTHVMPLARHLFCYIAGLGPPWTSFLIRGYRFPELHGGRKSLAASFIRLNRVCMIRGTLHCSEIWPIIPPCTC